MNFIVKQLVRQKFPPNRTRSDANISEFARAIGVPYKTAFNIYEGKAVKLDFQVLDKICDVLDSEPGEIIGRVPKSLEVVVKEKSPETLIPPLAKKTRTFNAHVSTSASVPLTATPVAELSPGEKMSQKLGVDILRVENGKIR